MSQELVLRNDEGNVAHLTLNDPSKLNVLTHSMLDQLLLNLESLQQDTTIRCVVIKADGKAFCAGHDLSELLARDRDAASRTEFLYHLFDLCATVMQKIQMIPQPVIAQVHGTAVAAGCQLVASCDLAIAGQKARFGVNGVNIGLFCSTPMVALTRNISTKKAFELLTTGKIVDAQTAKEIGLINEVVSDQQLDQAVEDMATTIASKLSEAVKIGKEAFYRQAQLNLDEAYKYTGRVMVENMGFKNTAEGIDAFLEKREPNWSD